MPAAFDLLTTRRTGSQIDLWVSSVTGSDSNAGTSQDAPLATAEEAMARIPTNAWARRAVVHYLEHQETLTRPLLFPPMIGSGHIDDVAIDAAEPSWDFQRVQIQHQAEPIFVENVNGVITLDDSTSQMVVITDSSKNWTTNEHRGRFVLNPGNIAEYGVIWANTATQLRVVQIMGAFTDGTLTINRRAARFTLGDPTAFITAGMIMAGAMAPVGFVGLSFAAASGAGPALDIVSHAGVAFFLCEIEGGILMRPGASVVSFDGCYLHGGAWAPNGQPVALRGSFLDGVAMGYHGSGGAGQYDIFGSRFDNCGSLGHGGTSLPEGGFNIDQCWITNGTSHGISYLGGSRARIRRTRIDSCAGNAINVDGCGNLRVETVTGSGSTGYGCSIDNGAHVLPVSASVTGASGEVRLGGVNYNWSQAPQVSASRLCRFGT